MYGLPSQRLHAQSMMAMEMPVIVWIGRACDMILVTKPPREVGFCERVVEAQAILEASTV